MTAAEDAGANNTLYVDLDGTLVATDTLWESFGLLLRRHPFLALLTPLWLLRGKATLKSQIARRVCPDAARLPYRTEVIDFLERAKAAGRPLVLATASHERIAHAVADQLGIFSDVLATTEDRNLKSAAKLERIREHAAGAPIAYVGDSAADLRVWEGADECFSVAASARLAQSAAKRGIELDAIEMPAPPNPVLAFLRALRPHQWAKNVLLLAPITLAHELANFEKLSNVVLGIIAFCMVASSGYLINDIVDIEADRNHPTKRRRPFAAGTLPIPVGPAALVGLVSSGFAIAIGLVSMPFAAMLLIYLVATLYYSFSLKERLFLDVLILAGLYTHRVLAGGVAADIEVSAWLLAFSVFFFLSLALVKRYVELLDQSAATSAQPGPASEGTADLARRAYQTGDLGIIETMGLSSGYVSVLVLGLYVSRDDVSQFYATPELLWLVTPLMLYWISRIWLLARRGEVTADPVFFAATDRISYAIVAAIAGVGLLASGWGTLP